MKIVVAITAASGGIYARLTLERLLRSSEVSQIALVCSAHAREVLAHEDVVLPEDACSSTLFFASVTAEDALYSFFAIVFLSFVYGYLTGTKCPWLHLWGSCQPERAD